MKRISSFLIALIFVFWAAMSVQAATIYPFTGALTGGGTGALDKRTGTVDKDGALVIFNGEATYGNAGFAFSLDAVGGCGSESAPTCIESGDSGEWWELVNWYMMDAYILGDDIFATTNTAGYLWIGDGTNYNPTAPAAVTNGDATHYPTADHVYDYIAGTPAIGTPSSLTLTSATGLPIVAGTTGTLSATRGGTDQTVYVIGDLLYASTTTALSKRAAVALGSVFTSAGVGTAPVWNSAPQINSINLGHASDTTLARTAAGVVTIEGSYVAKNPMTTTGDMTYASTTATPATSSRIAAVALGSVLTSKGVATAPAWDSAPQITQINLGHASDTTLARTAAGVVTIEGAYIAKNPTTAIGDLLYGSTAATPSALARLAAPAAGQVLVSAGVATPPAWSATPYISTGIELSHATANTLTASSGVLSVEGVALPRKIASGATALDFASTATGACATVIQASATGVATTDVIIFNANASIKAVTGYVPADTGGFSISAFPTTNYVNFEACNWTAGTVDPGSITVNWMVIR